MEQPNMGEAARRTAATAMPPQRPDMRLDPRESARLRAAEILGHADILDEGPDVFYFDRSKIPDGWDYEWKVLTVYGKEYPAEQTKMARTGWEPVPASRHPEEMPKGYPGTTIEREGQILMQRPLEVSDYMREKSQADAKNQVRNKLEQITNTTSPLEDPRKAKRTAKVNKSYEPMKVPD